MPTNSRDSGSRGANVHVCCDALLSVHFVLLGRALKETAYLTSVSIDVCFRA